MANLLTSVESINTQEYELVVKPFLDDPKIQALPFNFMYGNMPREVHFTPNADKIMGAKTTCGWTVKGGGLNSTKKTLTPIEVQATVTQCYTVVLKKLFGDKLPDGHKRGELYPELINWMTEQQQYAFNRDLLSILFLGDTAATPDDYYSLLNGLYTALVAGIAANDGTVDATDIVLDDTSLNTTNFYLTMKSVYGRQSRQLKNIDKSKRLWIWTDKMYEKYTDYLTVSTQNTAGQIQRDGIINGTDANNFVGIPILVMKIVDERLETDFLTGSPATPLDPYRTILTAPDNHLIIMDGQGLLSTDPFYLPKEDEVWVPGSALIDYKYGFGDQNVLAGVTIS